MAEQRYVLGIAHQAGPDPKIREGMDGGRDWISPAELEKAAWGFLRTHPQVGINHAEGTQGSAEVVESYIYRGPDWPTGTQDIDGNEIVVKAGDWLLGAICNPYAWELLKAGYLDGWSVQGTARRLSND